MAKTKEKQIDIPYKLNRAYEAGGRLSIDQNVKTILDLLKAVEASFNLAAETAKGDCPEADKTLIACEHRSDRIWGEISDYAERITVLQARSLQDVASKIAIWRRIAPEQAQNAPHQSVDEKLLVSIMRDIERLCVEETPAPRQAYRITGNA